MSEGSSPMGPEGAALRVQGVSKRYSRRRGARFSLRGLLFGGRRRERATEFWALRDVSFEVRPGGSTALIGGNGAGKSTLLRLAAGLSEPTEGSIEIPRDTVSVLGLGASFDPTLTGAENALTALVVNGMSRREAARRLDDVRAFAELEDFFDSPVRTYSSGMGLRLAFATAAQLHAEAFLVDEVLSVGDLRFQERCVAHLESLRAAGATILMASHDLDLVVKLCDEAVWLQGGRVRRTGPAAEVVAAYREASHSRTVELTPAPEGGGQPPGGAGAGTGGLELRRNRFGSQELTLEEVAVNGGAHALIEPGDPVRVSMRVAAGERPRRAWLGVSIHRSDDGLELVNEQVDLGTVDADRPVSFTLERLDAAPGRYHVDVGVYEEDWEHAYDYHWAAYTIEVAGPRRPGGNATVLRPPARWSAEGAGLAAGRESGRKG